MVKKLPVAKNNLFFLQIGLSQVEIDTINDDCNRNALNATIKKFEAWKVQECATVNVMIRALEKIDLNLLARDIEKMIQVRIFLFCFILYS